MIRSRTTSAAEGVITLQRVVLGFEMNPETEQELKKWKTDRLNVLFDKTYVPA